MSAKEYSFLRIWSHLLKKSVMENFIFCAVFSPNWDYFYDHIKYLMWMIMICYN